MKIIWLGGVFTEDALHRFLAVNQAANRWTAGLLNGLKNEGHSIYLIAHRPEPACPKGSLLPGDSRELDPQFDGEIVRYLNILHIRKYILKTQYRKALIRAVKDFSPDLILCYNPYLWNIAAGQLAVETFNIPWVPVVLDYDDPRPDWKVFRKTLSAASGFVFLSYWGFKNCPLPKPKLHLDGGNEGWYGDIVATHNQNKQVLLYAGKYTIYGGVDIMAEALLLIKTKNVEIWLCGKGDSPFIKRLYDNDPRVKKLGFVSNDELHQLHQRADLFLNLRPADIDDNRMIFPSKILNYLSYGKPVVSSRTAGLSQEYSRFLQVPRNDTAKAIAEKIDEVFSWSQTKKIKYRDSVRSWFKASRTWGMQARRLGEWLEKEIL
ncbi:MAG: glycosyltransferase [Deltaproteobacteria bacterium]|nr:glycosyltransferase [Deltaproteobacteria bacterium]